MDSALKIAIQCLANTLGLPVLYPKGILHFSRATVHKTWDNSPKMEDGYPAIELDVHCRASFTDEKGSTGMVVQVCGDLHLLVSHYHSTKATSAFLIDGKRSNIDACIKDITRTSSLRDVYDLLRPGVIKTYLFDGAGWTSITTP